MPLTEDDDSTSNVRAATRTQGCLLHLEFTVTFKSRTLLPMWDVSHGLVMGKVTDVFCRRSEQMAQAYLRQKEKDKEKQEKENGL